MRAAEAGTTCVLQARPAESEASLSYAVLADLVGPVFDETRAALPAPQERALAATLLRVATVEPADPRTTATALVGVLGELAREGPVLVAIDDVQWVDAASERALEFAARRLPARLGMLLAKRSEGEDEAPLDLDRALPEDRLMRIVLGPLSLASLHHVVTSRLAGPLARPMLARIAQASGGNPLFALEIARALGGAGEESGEVSGRCRCPTAFKKLAGRAGRGAVARSPRRPCSSRRRSRGLRSKRSPPRLRRERGAGRRSSRPRRRASL